MKLLKKSILSVIMLGFSAYNMAQNIDNLPQQTRKPKKHISANRGNHYQEMMQTLNLSPEQMDKMKSITEKNKAQMMTIRKKNKMDRIEMKKMRTETDNEIANILNPEQLAKYKTLKNEMKDRMSEKIREKRKINQSEVN